MLKITYIHYFHFRIKHCVRSKSKPQPVQFPIPNAFIEYAQDARKEQDKGTESRENSESKLNRVGKGKKMLPEHAPNKKK